MPGRGGARVGKGKEGKKEGGKERGGDTRHTNHSLLPAPLAIVEHSNALHEYARDISL